MENTITNNAISASLLARNVYGVCFPQRDTMDALHSEFAAAREKFFTGGRKRVRVGRSEVVQGFDGKLKGKVSRRGLYWKKTAAGMAGGKAIALEEAFDQRGGHVLVRRDFRNIIVSRTFFDKGQIWLKSEYYEPWDAVNARVIFKPSSTEDTVERFDWDGENKRYRSTLLYPVPYLAGTPEQSILGSRFGQPPFLVSTGEAGGMTAYRGEYQDGKRHGFGAAYYKDGALSYAGFWKAGKKDGLGVSFRDGDHALHIARWENGKPGGFVSLFDSQGSLRYSGRFVNGKKQGAGVTVNPADGTLLGGKWQDGEATGVGSAFDQEGNLLYYGGWKDGKRHGQGTEFDKNGAIVFDGEWRDGKYHNGILYQKLVEDGESDGPDWDL